MGKGKGKIATNLNEILVSVGVEVQQLFRSAVDFISEAIALDDVIAEDCQQPQVEGRSQPEHIHWSKIQFSGLHRAESYCGV